MHDSKQFQVQNVSADWKQRLICMFTPLRQRWSLVNGQWPNDAIRGASLRDSKI